MENSATRVASLRTLSKTMLVIVRVAAWASLAAACLLLLASIAIGFVPESFFGRTETAKDMKFVFSQPFVGLVGIPAGSSSKAILLASFLVALPYCAWSGFFFLPISRVLTSVVRGRPFDPRNARFLSSLAICVAISPFAGWVAAGLVDAVLGAFSIPGPVLRFSYDMTALVLAALLYVLSGVFKYGAELQRDVDETV